MARPRHTRATSNAPAAIADAAAPIAPGWSPRARAIVSLLIVVHLSAVLLAALTAVGGSDLWRLLAVPLGPYIQAVDLKNHGYRFFAPDPGPSHLVRYYLTMPDGSQREGVFPNLAEEKPRLLYHRYFMLSEHLYASEEMRAKGDAENRTAMAPSSTPAFAPG